MTRALGCGLLVVAWIAGGGPAKAEDGDGGPVVQDVLEILKERGIVDEGEYARLSAKNQRYEEDHTRFMPKLEWFGDFRGRYEGFWYDRDNENDNRKNRHRLRYRLRIGAKAEINDYIGAQFRLTSGNEHDSRNQTLGSGFDFDPDFIGIDQAFITLTPLPALGETVPGGSLAVRFGKVPNPFTWKHGQDYIWDGDITPEGVDLLFSASPLENFRLFANAGYYVISEQGTGGDPHLFALQGGTEIGISDTVSTGGRVSFYSFHSLDPAFVDRNADDGNVRDGLAGDAAGEHGAEVIESAAWLRIAHFDAWPILVYGGLAYNLDAEESDLFPEADSENLGWNLAMEIGDKKKWLMLGGGYWHWQANFFPARFVDSDLFDGITNREGWALYGVRQILPNTDLSFTLFYGSDEIEDFPGARIAGGALNPFLESVRDAERIRLQTNLQVKF